MSKIETLSYRLFVKFRSVKLSSVYKVICKEGIESVNLQVSTLI
jgi:hypothetical protein